MATSSPRNTAGMRSRPSMALGTGGKRTGYKVIRARLKDGIPTGEYEDFMTGFVVNGSSVWARPVGVAVAHDGALLVSEDGNGTMWRVSYRGGP